MEIARPRRACVYREKSFETGQLSKALASAQGKFLPVVKDSTAQYGPFASLASMRRATAAALAEAMLSVHFEYADVDDYPYLIAVLSHASGEWVSSSIRMERIADPQKRTAYMTYMKRAAYSALLCLAAEADDDGETASAAATQSHREEQAEVARLARDAIASATTPQRVEAIIEKCRSKIASGELSQAAMPALVAAAGDKVLSLEAGK